MWKAYVDYVDEIIVDGFFNTILCSLKFMIENTDEKTTTEPFYEAVLELQVCALRQSKFLFQPSNFPNFFTDFLTKIRPKSD